MRLQSWSAIAALGLLIASVPAVAQVAAPPEPARDAGSSVTGAFEGWFKNPDGTFSLLLGYYNRNRKQEVDLPVGPSNQIQPGGPDRGQPTHFLPGRAWGVFTVNVPADFGQNTITWTIVANGKTTVIPAGLKPDYEISPLVEASVGNTPPVLRFQENGPSVQGPQGISVQRAAKVGSPLALTAWISDDAKFTTSSGARPKNLAPPVTVKWTMFRGPAPVSFSKDRPEVEKLDFKEPGFSGKATTSVMFSQPGEYVLHIVANDYSGEGGAGFQCCWTNGQVKVSVQP
jgi:hypothetical protein